MNPTFLVILQYALQYGIPAALEIVKLFQKSNPTLADWEAAFQVAQTPYGLTPNTALMTPAQLIDLGVVRSTVATPTTDIPAEFQAAPTFVIVKVIADGNARTVCNALGNCWYILDATKVAKTPGTGGEVWQVGEIRFWITAAALVA